MVCYKQHVPSMSGFANGRQKSMEFEARPFMKYLIPAV